MSVFKFLEKHIEKITIISCVMILFMPYLLTRHWSCSCIDFSTTGQIGDTIAGTTAPVIGMISILLIYMTYHSQKEELEKTRLFLKEQTESAELSQQVSSLENLIQEVNNYINEIEWDGHKGVAAIRVYQINNAGITTSFLDEYNSILISFDILIKATKAIKNLEVRMNYLSRIYTLFYSRILWNTKMNIFDKQKDDIMNKNDDAQLIIPKYVNLSLETLNFMLNNGLSKSSEYKDKNINDLRKFHIKFKS